MGCCSSKKDKDDPLLDKKDSIDYNAVTTNISWEVIDEKDKKKRRQKHDDLNFAGSMAKTQYVDIGDDGNLLDQVPNLNKIDSYNKNVRSRSRQSSAASQYTQNNTMNSSLINNASTLSSASLPNTTTMNTTSTMTTFNPTDISMMSDSDTNINEWKPSIITTYNIELTSPKQFNNKELLTLLKMYHEYFDKQMKSTKKNDDDYITPNGENNDFINNNNDNDNINNGDNNINSNYNENAYNSFLSLYNWYEKENKKGGQQAKLKRIEQFCIGTNLWYLPSEVVSYLNEYYEKTQFLTLSEKEIEKELTKRDKYYISILRDIININQTSLKNVNFVEINGIKLYYKIYYPLNYNLYSQRIPLLLISELSQCKEDWLKLPELLCLNRPIITFDMRGIGQTGISINASLQNNYSIDLLTSDIAGLIEKLYPKQSIFILGNGGIGGIIAQTLCIRFEHLINGLIICNTLIPSNNGPKNLYKIKYNNKFMNNNSYKNKINKFTNNNKIKTIGCVESVFLLDQNQNDHDDDGKEGEGDDNDDINDQQIKTFFYKDYEGDDNNNNLKNKNNKLSPYSYVMECQQNKQCPFILNTINGQIIGSLLNRPSNGILAQQNGFIKSISTKTNVISSRINEIKPSTLILYGNRDYVIDCQSSHHLSQKLIDVELKQINLLKNAGHLWWLTHSKESSEIINEFLFKIERNLLTRYDVIIENCIHDQQKEINQNEYKIIIGSTSFIADKHDEYQQNYQISSNDLQQIQYPLYCKFLCILTDLGRKPLHIKIVDEKNKKLIGIGQCMLTEATNASLIIDIVNVDDNGDGNGNDDNNDVLCKFVIKHGWNKQEFQNRLNNNDNNNYLTPNGFNNNMNNNNNNDQISRLDSADLSDYDL